MKKSQVGIEYIIIMGFVAMAIMVVLAIALTYTGSVKDRIKISQSTNCAEKIVSEAESVFYLGSPSKSVFQCYMPDNVQDIEIFSDSIMVTSQTSTGINKVAFPCKVPLSGTISSYSGLRKVSVVAGQDSVTISLV